MSLGKPLLWTAYTQEKLNNSKECVGWTQSLEPPRCLRSPLRPAFVPTSFSFAACLSQSHHVYTYKVTTYHTYDTFLLVTFCFLPVDTQNTGGHLTPSPKS